MQPWHVIPVLMQNVMHESLHSKKKFKPKRFSIARIRAACLPKRNLGNLTGKSGRVSGWGTTSFGGPSSNVLQQTSIPIVDNSVCSQPSVYGNRFSTIDICAFSNGKDACQVRSCFLLCEKNIEVVIEFHLLGCSACLLAPNGNFIV